MNTFPIMLGTLCVFALAYRYYSAFIAAKALVLDDRRTTPAHTYEDGHNYVPSPKWVLFGHHFAAISGAGPLIGPVLAAHLADFGRYPANAGTERFRQAVAGWINRRYHLARPIDPAT